MKAVVYQGNGKIALEDRPIPKRKDARDAIVKVSRSAICTSDLHIKNGAVPRAAPGVILGHEFTGEIVEAGEGLEKLKPGDRVAANCETFCGQCWFCKRGYVNNCENGGWELGCRIDGGQAEYVRVPFADQCLTVIPDTLTDENALFLGDILSSGYFGAELCGLTPGDCVAIIGAGPVGLCAAQCARLFGAGKVILIDIDPWRLDLAENNGIADIMFSAHDMPLEQQIKKLTGGRGADAVIEAAGTDETFQLAWRIARPNAVVALVAMYETPQTLPLPQMYGKNLIFKTGGVDARHCERLMQLIDAGRLHTDFLITHRGSLLDALEGYRVFEGKQDHCVKWVITP